MEYDLQLVFLVVHRVLIVALSDHFSFARDETPTNIYADHVSCHLFASTAVFMLMAYTRCLRRNNNHLEQSPPFAFH